MTQIIPLIGVLDGFGVLVAFSDFGVRVPTLASNRSELSAWAMPACRVISTKRIPIKAKEDENGTNGLRMIGFGHHGIRKTPGL